MTTVSLQIKEDAQDFIQEIKKLVVQFQPKVSDFTISQDNTTKDEVLSSFTQICRDIKSGEAFNSARPIEELYKELAND